MIAFGASITRPEVFRACAEPGIRRVAEPDSETLTLASSDTIARSYNTLLDRAAALDGLEALVLVHQDAELIDADLCATLRQALADPQVGVVGCVGAIGVTSIAWWEGSVTLASFVNRYDEHGGGDLRSFSWDPANLPPYTQVGEVETLDGFVLAFSPWAVRNVRFDEQLGTFHGYDLDVCLQIREAGRKVVTADFRAIHHRPLEMLPEPEEWIDAHMLVAEKWDGRMPRIGRAPGTWRERALRAEAERDAARAVGHSRALEAQARTTEIERALAEARESVSWRLTAPLRLLSGFRRGERPARRPSLGPDLRPRGAR